MVVTVWLKSVLVQEAVRTTPAAVSVTVRLVKCTRAWPGATVVTRGPLRWVVGATAASSHSQAREARVAVVASWSMATSQMARSTCNTVVPYFVLRTSVITWKVWFVGKSAV